MMNSTTLVIDSHGLLYQLFHALPPMTSPQGEPVGALFGFIRDLLTLRKQVAADFWFAAFDSRGPTFRHSLFSEYKANRAEMPVDLRPQIAFVKEVLTILGIPVLEADGYEADDILATVAMASTTGGSGGGQCILITSDKDARQLLNDQVAIYSLRNLQKRVNPYYRQPELLADWGIRPEQVVDFQAMVGDTSDNIPGFAGIGPKTAQQFLTTFGTLDHLLENIDKIGKIVGEKKKNAVSDGKEQVLISRNLVRLKTDVPIEIPWERAATENIDWSKLHSVCARFGFRKLLAELPPSMTSIPATSSSDDTIADTTDIPQNVHQRMFFDPPTNAGGSPNSITVSADMDDLPLFARMTPPVSGDDTSSSGVSESRPQYRVVSPDVWPEFLEKLRHQKEFSFDVETVSIDSARFYATQPRYCRLVGMSCCWDDTTAWYLPFRGPEKHLLLSETEHLPQLAPIFEDEKVGKIGQNLKFDAVVLRNYGITMRGICFDTMLADYILHAGFRHDINDIALRYLNFTMQHITDLIGTGTRQIGMDDVPIARIVRYACDDVWIPWRLRPILTAALQESPELWKLLVEVEQPLAAILIEMECCGVTVDTAKLSQLSILYETQIRQLEMEIFDFVGHSFNISSPKQLQEVLFQELKLPITKKTATGASTDVEVLETLAQSHEFPRKIVHFRQATKLKNTYIDVLPQLTHPETGRIHAAFNQSVTATGRLSSSNPNLQNIPVRTAEGREIRECFIPGDGYDVLVSCDYSQVELRVLAHFTQDTALISAFEADEDIHSRVAGDVFGVPLSEVTSEMRRRAKAVNFGIVYGQTPYGLAKQLGVTQDEAAVFIVEYFRRYPQIRDFFDRVLADAHHRQYVTTLFGRRRMVSGVRDSLKMAKDGTPAMTMMERTAINTVIQGTAADLMKLAMCSVAKEMATVSTPLRANLLLQIHDELVFEVTEKDVETFLPIVEKAMLLGQPLRVPLKIDTTVGKNWAQ